MVLLGLVLQDLVLHPRQALGLDPVVSVPVVLARVALVKVVSVRVVLAKAIPKMLLWAHLVKIQAQGKVDQPLVRAALGPPTKVRRRIHLAPAEIHLASLPCLVKTTPLKPHRLHLVRTFRPVRTIHLRSGRIRPARVVPLRLAKMVHLHSVRVHLRLVRTQQRLRLEAPLSVRKVMETRLVLTITRLALGQVGLVITARKVRALV